MDAEDIRDRAVTLASAGASFSAAPHLVHRDVDTGIETWMAFFGDPDGSTLALLSRVTPSDA